MDLAHELLKEMQNDLSNTLQVVCTQNQIPAVVSLENAAKRTILLKYIGLIQKHIDTQKKANEL